MICTSEASEANSLSFRVTERPSDTWRCVLLHDMVVLHH